MKSDRILFLLGLMCHLIGMPLTEYVDVRWFYLVLAGEGIWMIYAQVGWKRKKDRRSVYGMRRRKGSA